MNALVLTGGDRRHALVAAPFLSRIAGWLPHVGRALPWALVPLLLSMPPPILVPQIDVIHTWPILVAQVLAVVALIAWVGA